MEPEAILLGSTWEEVGVAYPAIVTVVELDYDDNMVRYESENCSGSMPVPAFRATFRPYHIHKKWKHREKGYIVTIVDFGNDYLRFIVDNPKEAGTGGGR